MNLVAFLKAIRYPNLIIIALSQVVLRYGIIAPLADAFGYDLVLSTMDFSLLVLSSVLIAAGGNIINDYFDIKIDRVNKPEKIIIGKTIKRRVAMVAHITLTALGGLMAVYMSWHAGLWKLSVIHLFVIYSLWQYSLVFKHRVLIGNLLIGILAALVPLLVGLYEIPLLNQTYGEELRMASVQNGEFFSFNALAYWTLGFAAFAFVMTFSREIVKDIADIPGDAQYGSQTLPVKYGTSVAKKVVLALQALVIIGVIYCVYVPLEGEYRTAVYAWIGLILPLLYMCFLLYKAESRADFLKVSNWNKGVSVVGIMYALLAYFIINQAIGAI